MRWRDRVRRLAARAGFSVHRWPANRFDATADALTLLQRAGYAPTRIIDAGANVGQFATIAARVFPEASFDLVEPQPECAPALARFAAAHGRTRIHGVAVTAPGTSRVAMHRGASSAASTGTFVTAPDESFSADLEVDATTLDRLFGDVSARDRALLKLDLEGHEIAALSGATALLGIVEVLYVEVTFDGTAGERGTRFVPLASLLAERGFDVFDFGMLAGRSRDLRLRIADVVFARRGSALTADAG